MEFPLQYKNKSDGFKDNKPEPNNNETEQYKLGTIFSSYNSLSCWVLMIFSYQVIGIHSGK